MNGREFTPVDGVLILTHADGVQRVCIDPESREQVDALDAAYQSAIDSAPKFHSLAEIMQTALRSLIAPPKPEEPTGRYSVVVDAKGDEWLRDGLDHDRAHTGPWWNATGAREFDGSDARRANYADIAAVRVLSEGVTA